MTVVSGSSRTFTLALGLSSALAAQQPAAFVPPRISSVALPAPSAPNVIGGGEVLIEAIIDRSGAVTRPVLLRSTPPYAQLMLDAIVRWRFAPARAPDPKGQEVPVDAPMLIAAVYRPPTLYGGPTAGEPPKNLAMASFDIPYPSALIAPAYPPKAIQYGTAAVLLEATIDETGAIRNVRTITDRSGVRERRARRVDAVEVPSGDVSSPPGSCDGLRVVRFPASCCIIVRVLPCPAVESSFRQFP